MTVTLWSCFAVTNLSPLSRHNATALSQKRSLRSHSQLEQELLTPLLPFVIKDNILHQTKRTTMMKISLLQLLGLCLAASSITAFVSVPMRGRRATTTTTSLSMTASFSPGGSLERSMGYTATGFGKPDNKAHNKKKKKTKDVHRVAPTPEQEEEVLVLESPPLRTTTEQEPTQWDVFSSRLRESDVIRAAQEALKQSEMVLAYQQQHDVVVEEDSAAVSQDCVAATSVPEEVQAPVAAQEEAQAAAAAVENTHFLPDVRPSTIAGAAIAGALASSLLLGNNDSVLLVAASAASYLSICRGAAGDVARSLGEGTWACTKMTFDLFQELISPAPSSDVGVKEETTPARQEQEQLGLILEPRIILHQLLHII